MCAYNSTYMHITRVMLKYKLFMYNSESIYHVAMYPVLPIKTKLIN